VGFATQIIGTVRGTSLEKGGKIIGTMQNTKSLHDRSSSKFREAALIAISQSGIDHITVNQICSLAKKTRPNFYSYFDGIYGVLADTWLNEGADFLTRLVHPSYDAVNTEVSIKDRALLEILAISHRVAELSETINPLLTKWWNNLSHNEELKSLKFSWLLAERMGAMLMGPLDGESKPLGSADELLLSLDWVGKANSDDLPDLEPTNPNPTTPDPTAQNQSLDETLIKATIQVVSKTGIEATSMARVARLAQVSPGSIYPRYPNVEELVIATFRSVAEEILTEKIGGLRGNPEASLLGMLVLEALIPERANLRNFGLEIHLEGRVNNKIGEQFQASNLEIHAKLKAALNNSLQSELASEVLTNLFRALSLGFSILINAGIPLNELDHRPISRQIVREARKIGQKPAK